MGVITLKLDGGKSGNGQPGQNGFKGGAGVDYVCIENFIYRSSTSKSIYQPFLERWAGKVVTEAWGVEVEITTALTFVQRSSRGSS